MPDYVCMTDDLFTDATCSGRGGLLSVFWIDSSFIDWTAMALAANFDEPNNTILNWVITGGGTWGELQFERENGRLDALFTSDNDYYEVSLLNLLFSGHTTARTTSIGNAIACCNLILQVFDNNGSARIFGREHVGGAWVTPVRQAKIVRHLDTSGAFGSADDGSRDEFDIQGRHSYPISYSSVDYATMQTL